MHTSGAPQGRRALVTGVAVAALTLALTAYWWVSGRQPRPPGPATPAPASTPRAATTSGVSAGGAIEPDADAVRREGMARAYADLEQDRRSLNARLGDLNAQLWDLKFPAQQAGEVSRVMMQARALLNDPPLLGAFGSVAEIDQERARLRAASDGLDGLAPLIEAQRTKTRAPAGR